MEKTVENQKLLEENRKLRQSLEQAQAMISRFELLKAKMLKILSHDLRTPLASIRGYSELLKSGVKGRLSEAQKKLLGVAIQEADHLNGLINDSQDLFLLDAGQLNLDKEPIPLEELIHKALPRIQVVSELKEIPVETDLQSPLPVVHVDIPRMLQVLVNLMRGTLKHTSRGGKVLLTAGMVGPMVEVRIIQKGQGISIEQLELNGTQDGFRIALGLAREILQEHGGEMGVESNSREMGTTFWLKLPVLRAPTEIL